MPGAGTRFRPASPQVPNESSANAFVAASASRVTVHLISVQGAVGISCTLGVFSGVAADTRRRTRGQAHDLYRGGETLHPRLARRQTRVVGTPADGWSGTQGGRHGVDAPYRRLCGDRHFGVRAP